jgi:DNA-binding MarR family transcriptional regulator
MMESKFKTPENSPGFLLWKLTTEWQKKLRMALKPLDLTHVQFVFLASLQWLAFQTNTDITQSHIAETSKMDKMVISETTKKLLEKNLITRKRHKTDSRSYMLGLSENGLKLIDQALPIVEAIDIKFFNENKSKVKTLAIITSNL